MWTAQDVDGGSTLTTGPKLLETTFDILRTNSLRVVDFLQMPNLTKWMFVTDADVAANETCDHLLSCNLITCWI